MQNGKKVQEKQIWKKAKKLLLKKDAKKPN